MMAWMFTITNIVYMSPSSLQAVFIGGQRSLTMDPKPFNGTITIHEAGWMATRWSEIPINKLVSITGDPLAPTYQPIIADPAHEFPVDRALAKYRYTRGNRITGNLFRRIHRGTRRVFFGDGVIYLSGVGQINSPFEANTVIGNIFLGNPGGDGDGIGAATYEQVYVCKEEGDI